MSMNPAVRRLHVDLQHLRKARSNEKKAVAAVKSAGVSEKAALATIADQKQRIIDQFVSPAQPLDGAGQLRLLNQTAGLGRKQVETTDKFEKIIAKERRVVASDKIAIHKDRKKALRDLKPAEFHIGLHDTNRVRHELGLKRVAKPFRAPAGKHVTGYVNGRPHTITVVPVGNGAYLQPAAAKAFKKMVAAAAHAGIQLGANSGFRTMAEQTRLWNQFGHDRNRVAPPGFSNHQNGVAMDISGVNGRGTRADHWLLANSGRFGFRNYPAEAWHYDFVG